MKRVFHYIFLFFTSTVLMAFSTSIAATSVPNGVNVITSKGEKIGIYKDYHALVMGVGNYEHWPKLKNTVSDVKEVSANLENLGFHVKLVLDPTYVEMKSALKEMVFKMGNKVDRAILLYYAGHGYTQKLPDKTSLGYLIPKDCPLLEEDSLGFASHAISMKEIESVSLKISSRHVLMLFDSCFSMSIFSLFRAVPEDITKKSALPVRQFITAGREKEEMPENSIFKRCFLKGLHGDADLIEDGYITGSELGMYLQEDVPDYTKRRQHPQYAKINNPDFDIGDFIFDPLGVRHGKPVGAKKAQGEKESLDRKESLSNREIEKAKIRQLQAERKAALEKAEKEAAEKKALEEELKRLKVEKRLREEAARKKALEEELKKLKTAQAPKKQKAEPETRQKKDSEKQEASAKMKPEQRSDRASEHEKKLRLAAVPTASRSLKEAIKSGKAPFLVDDFEDKDLWSANRYFEWKTRFKNDGKIRISVDDTQGAKGSSCSMKIDYELGEKSGVFVMTSRTHEYPGKSVKEVMTDKSITFDLSRFRKLVFYLKGKKADSLFSKPNGIHYMIYCHDDDAVLKSGRRTWVSYLQTAVVRPDKNWKRIEIPFDDFAPSNWTRKNVNFYEEKPDLKHVIGSLFMFGSWVPMGGWPESNTVWIDEIQFE